jgi:hypothetical protein
MPKWSPPKSRFSGWGPALSVVLLPLVVLVKGSDLTGIPRLIYGLLIIWPILTLVGRRVQKPAEPLSDSVVFALTGALATYLLVAAVLLLQPALLKTLSGFDAAATSGSWTLGVAALFCLSGLAVLVGGVVARR